MDQQRVVKGIILMKYVEKKSIEKNMDFGNYCGILILMGLEKRNNEIGEV